VLALIIALASCVLALIASRVVIWQLLDSCAVHHSTV
jgi:hypothetical protein